MVGFFTWHAYKSWMPDREEGYVRRGEGVLPRDPEMADQYGRNSREDGVLFHEPIQREMIQAILTAAPFQRLHIHSVGTDSTHLHALVSWRDQRGLEKVKTSLRSSITRHLNNTLHRRTWLSDGGFPKQVANQRHFDHLLGTYIPKHTGWKWREGVGYYR